MEQDTNTESLIFDAAKSVFLEKGFDGAKMQNIADTAGINKALLHYYYRSKEKLFDVVFSQILNQFFIKMGEVWETELSIEEKISAFIDTYVDFLLKNPFIPRFVINTLARFPQNAGEVLEGKTNGIFTKMKSILQKIQNDIDKEAAAGQIKPVKIQDLMVNTISLIIFPIIAEPMIKMIFGLNQNDYKNFIIQRKQVIKDLLIRSLKK